MSTLQRHRESLAIARLGAGADLPSWVSSATLMSITATAGSTTVVCSAGAVPRKARPEGPYAAFEVLPDVGEARLGALLAALGGLPEETEARVVATVDHDWVLVGQEAAELVVEGWHAAGHEVVTAPEPSGAGAQDAAADQPTRRQS